MFIYIENYPTREAGFFAYRGRIQRWQFQLYQRLIEGESIVLLEENVAQVSGRHMNIK